MRNYAVTPFDDLGGYRIEPCFDPYWLDELFWVGELPNEETINNFTRNYLRRFLSLDVPQNTKAVVAHREKKICLFCCSKPAVREIQVDYSCLPIDF